MGSRHSVHSVHTVHTVSTVHTVLTALLTALVVAGAYVAIPVGPVPVTLQTFFVLLAALLGGRRIGIAAVALYLVLGALGLPVFSGGTGGLARFATPTGGFLIGLLPGAAFAAWCSDLGWHRAQESGHPARRRLLWMIGGGLGATVILYAAGIPFLKLNLDISWSKAFLVGLVPFIPGDLLKLAGAVLVSQKLAPVVKDYIDETDEQMDNRGTPHENGSN